MQLINKIKKKSLVRNIFIYGASDGISKIAPFIVIPIILKYLTPEDYGRIANFTAISNMFVPVILLNGHTFFSVQFHKKTIDQRDRLFWNIFNSQLVFFLLSLLIIALFGSIMVEYFSLSLNWIYLAIFLSFLKSFVFLFETIQRMTEKLKQFASIKIGNSILAMLLAILFVIVLDLAWQGRIYALILTASITVLVYFFMYKNLKFNFNFKITKEYLTFGLLLLPHSIAGWARDAVEKGMVTSITSIGDNGRLAVAGVSMAVIGMVSSSIFSAVNPEILSMLSQLDEKNEEEKKNKIVKMSFNSLVFILIAIILFYPINYLFFTFYLDIKYIEGLRYVPFLLISAFFTAVYAQFSLFILYEKKTKLLSQITVVTVIAHLVIAYFALTYYGVMGMVVSATFFSFFQSLIVAYYAQKIRPMPWLFLLKSKLLFQSK